jgi:hypothetical protein
MDVHKQETQVCIEDADGIVVLEQRIRTTPERFTALLGGRPRARILLEAATESEWVAQHLETLGHEVIVADPNYAAMYATRSRRVKTDRRDARTLADACRLGAYHPAHPRHHPTAAQQPLAVFAAVEQRALGPLEGAKRFDPPTWQPCKVHPDHHFQFDKAIYSLPTAYVGRQLWIRADTNFTCPRRATVSRKSSSAA